MSSELDFDALEEGLINAIRKVTTDDWCCPPISVKGRPKKFTKQFLMELVKVMFRHANQLMKGSTGVAFLNGHASVLCRDLQQLMNTVKLVEASNILPELDDWDASYTGTETTE